MDISVSIYQPEQDSDVPPGRDETDPIAARAYYRRGDVIAVEFLHNESVTARRIKILNVTDAPEPGVDLDASLRRIILRLTERATIGVADGIEEVRYRRWRFLIPELRANQRAGLKNDGRITIPWPYFKARCAQKFIVDPDDQSADTLDVRLQDEDL